MQVICCDVDGVLVWAGDPDRPFANFTEMDPAKVAILNRILKETGAYIVLSSTWRISTDWDKTLVKNGLPKDRILGRTNHKHRFEVKRSTEISWFLAEHPCIDRWAVLDDDKDAFDDRFPEHAFQTFWEAGLTDELANEMIIYLQTGYRPPKEFHFPKAGDECGSCHKGIMMDMKDPKYKDMNHQILECSNLLCRMGCCIG